MSVPWNRIATGMCVVTCVVAGTVRVAKVRYGGQLAMFQKSRHIEYTSVRGLTPWPTATPALSYRPKVAVIEFGDFQCPYCAQFHATVFKRIVADFIDTNLIEFTFRHLPLPSHPLAADAARAVDCARQQGRFWEMHDALFGDPSRLHRSAYVQIAQSMNLSESSFAICLERQSNEALVSDLAEASRLGVRGTPTFVIGRIDDRLQVQIDQVVAGAQPYDTFAKAISATLALK